MQINHDPKHIFYDLKKKIKEGSSILIFHSDTDYGPRLWVEKEELETRVKFPFFIWEEHIQGREECKER